MSSPIAQSDSTPVVNSPPHLPRCGFLALHIQNRAFESGWLASSDPQPDFGEKLSKAEAINIYRAFGRIASLFENELHNSALPCLHICVPPLDPIDGFEAPNSMRKVMKDIQWVLGPACGLSRFLDRAGLAEWIEHGLRLNDIDAVVLGGCRLSASVRACALELQAVYGQIDVHGPVSSQTLTGKLSVIVDLNLCADETRMYKPICNLCLDEYTKGCLYKCQHTNSSKQSPVQHAIAELREAGVIVVEEGEKNTWWTSHVFWQSPWRSLDKEIPQKETEISQPAPILQTDDKAMEQSDSIVETKHKDDDVEVNDVRSILRPSRKSSIEYDAEHINDCHEFANLWEDLNNDQKRLEAHELKRFDKANEHIVAAQQKIELSRRRAEVLSMRREDVRSRVMCTQWAAENRPRSRESNAPDSKRPGSADSDISSGHSSHKSSASSSLSNIASQVSFADGGSSDENNEDGSETSLHFSENGDVDINIIGSNEYKTNNNKNNSNSNNRQQ